MPSCTNSVGLIGGQPWAVGHLQWPTGKGGHGHRTPLWPWTTYSGEHIALAERVSIVDALSRR
jgi:hypothetical protein